jgi:hypothetical protein
MFPDLQYGACLHGWPHSEVTNFTTLLTLLAVVAQISLLCNQVVWKQGSYANIFYGSSVPSISDNRNLHIYGGSVCKFLGAEQTSSLQVGMGKRTAVIRCLMNFIVIVL